MKVAIYARVSTHEQTAENQLLELRRYADARGWTAVEYVDEGVSGAKDRRPALDQLVADVRRHRVQGVVCWRLDRLGRNLRHLVLFLDELAVARHRLRHARRGDRHEHAGGATRRRRARLDRGVRARAHSGTHPRRAGAGQGARQAYRKTTGQPAAVERTYGAHRASGGCCVGSVEVDRRATAPRWRGTGRDTVNGAARRFGLAGCTLLAAMEAGVTNRVWSVEEIVGLLG